LPGRAIATGRVPQRIPKYERRFTGFEDKIIALYARGLTVREIQAVLAEAYAVDVSPDLISTVSDAIVVEVTAWHSRPLEPLYPVVFFDALGVKISRCAIVRIKVVYLALAVLPDGSRDILGIWIEQTEGAKALGRRSPPCFLGPRYRRYVHLLRQSLDVANWQQRTPLAAARRAVYAAPSADLALAALGTFARGEWGQRAGNFPTTRRRRS
jgi:transposase-like protein